MWNFGGRGNEVTGTVKDIQWNNLSRLLDTRPRKAFIMKSIISFIICISATMCGGAVSTINGWLVSCRSSLLGALLLSGPSRSLLSAPMPSCSFLWLLGLTSLWHSCSSKSWFCLVRRSTAAVKVCTYLSRAIVHGSSPLLLLVVAIERVSTIQLFIWEAVVWLTRSLPNRCRQLMMPKIISKLHSSHVLQTKPAQQRRKKTLKKVPVWYRLNTLRRLSQRMFTTLECQIWGKLCVPYFLRVLVFYSSAEPTFIS